jgi:dihydropyrimidine dehydrogenase (NAD+) subunit PreA
MTTTFLGYKISSHLVAASCPSTETTEGVLDCIANGAAAVILKTAGGYLRSRQRNRDTDESRDVPAAPSLAETEEGYGERRCFINSQGFWAKSSFRREIMPINKGIELVREVKAATQAPVIASITECSLDIESWLQDCTAVETAGASAIQLDLFYMENILARDDFTIQFISLLREIICHCRIPIMPKLNIALPAEYAAYLFQRAGVHYVSLLDSIRSPAPLRFDEKGSPCRDRAMLGPGLSVFGSFMFPLTRFYTDALRRAGFEVCAGGGIQTAADILDLLLLGAGTVQMATEILLHGYRRFGELEKELNEALAAIGIEDSAALQKMGENISRPPDPNPLHAGFADMHSIGKKEWHLYYDPQQCSRCGVCTGQSFCRRIRRAGNTVSAEGCEGCGFCVSLCPTGAIALAGV